MGSLSGTFDTQLFKLGFTQLDTTLDLYLFYIVRMQLFIEI